jgi:uncharacterized protein (DUF2252 family)
VAVNELQPPHITDHRENEAHLHRAGKSFDLPLLRYRESLPDERRVLLDRFQRKGLAIKVLGVGSVGTFCAVMLMMADIDDSLFLQVNEAGPSVLEPYAGKSIYANHGQRVVNGLRLMQSACDLFLEWTEGHHF